MGCQVSSSSLLSCLFAFSSRLFQLALVQWKRRHFRSYHSVTLLGLWLVPFVFCIQYPLVFWRFLLVWTLFSIITLFLMKVARQTPLPKRVPFLVGNDLHVLPCVALVLSSSLRLGGSFCFSLSPFLFCFCFCSFFPSQVYSWFFWVYRICSSLFGFSVLLLLLDMTGTVPDFALGFVRMHLIICFYAVYFGLLGRDCADRVTDTLSSTMGMSGRGKKGRKRNRTRKRKQLKATKGNPIVIA